MKKIVVFDYGFGNVRSMTRALDRLGLDVTLTSDHDQALEADGLVVPGLGAFDACMEGLRTVGGDQVIYERLAQGLPVLGVCVGLQILFQEGLENGHRAAGLGLIGGQVGPLDADVVPHMGWDGVQTAEGSRLLKGLEAERFYFVHSCAASQAQAVDLELDGQRIDFGGQEAQVSWCSYGRSRFVAAYERGSLFATQFHPEKSAEAGSQLLANWVAEL
ncbi:imidazole glycerol phosphate synthase subunit HisH [Bifidobacterium aemilianum]|uniref:Imidazole glycerol phosphate synthase subunit HisH n=1 Tax=Bifidobacterium aemilianum TaxID=2493120 RepID=A0A366KBF3_9BIFI|nr:imidazole glycerol phosphate synthase subunit HisH [Bifidobacterium aemilianum]RBP98572.1 imidazole glycerol phosphate synthase subunit HisH [Bifidobacterium aemilianum]